MIRFARQSDIPALKALWKQTFEDEDAFIERFFEKRVLGQLKNAIVLEVQGVLVSMLYALPCTLAHGPSNTTYNAVNLVGVATQSAQQNKGYMRKLLEAAFVMLQEQGVEAIVLKPSNPRFYERFGFHICNTLYQVPFTKEQFVQPDVPVEQLPAFLCKRAADCSTEGYQILRGEEDWKFQLDDGACVSLWKDGYAICEPVDTGFIAYEMAPIEEGISCGYTMYKKIGRSPDLPEDIGRENLIFEWY